MNNVRDAFRQREMTALEAQLRSSVQVQLENTRDSIRCLGGAQDRLREAGDALSRVGDLCRQSETLIDNYPFIKQVSRTHQNFALTKRVYDELCALDAKVERCATLLETDQESGRPDNLLLVFLYLSRLEMFRRQTLELMQDAPSTAVYTIKRYFKKLDDLATAFEEFYWKLPRQLFTMAGAGQSEYIVSMVKVLIAMDAEERPRFTAILDDAIANKFRQAVASTGVTPSEDPSTVLEGLNFWQGDLLMARNELVPKFPPTLNIMDFFLLTYHRNIHSVLAQCLMAKLEPADILYIVGWVRVYHDDLAAQLGISADDLEPRLLDDREPELIAEYVTLSRGKINEWIGNLQHAEAKSFTERTAPPETDADNHYMTPTGIDLYQIIKQHIDAAAQASRGRLLVEIVGECAKSVHKFLADMTKVLEGERTKYLEKADMAAEYFEDYVVMLGNTCLKWVSYLAELGGELEDLLASEFVASGTKALSGLSEGFVNMAKMCSQVLVEIIFRSLKPALNSLFKDGWYNGEGLMDAIVATFDDYFKDYEQHADSFLLNKLVSDVLERLFIAYLEQLRSKSTKLKMPSAQRLLEADVTTMVQFFSSYRDPERVKKALDPLVKFVALASSSQRMVFLEFVSFWKLYPDVPMTLFEEVLNRRDDLDRAAVKEIMESCRKKTQEDKIVEAAPSIFSKLK
jgi:hypothetical protein